VIDVHTFSDLIPQEFIKPKEFWHGRSHCVNIKPLWMHSQVPVTHSRKVCPSMGREGHSGSANIGIPSCGTCRGVYLWFTHYCRGCGVFFIRDFYHPAFCDLYPVCWDCLPQLPWSHCPDHSNATSRLSDLTVEPIGLNPRKFTTEELQQAGINVFSFD